MPKAARKSRTEGRGFSVARPWGTKFILLPPLTEAITISTIGHAFGQTPDGDFYVHDFLIDQTQSTGGGSALVDPIQFDLTTGGSYRFHLTCQEGKNFIVNPPAGRSIYFGADLGRVETSGPPPGLFTWMTAVVNFEQFVGQMGSSYGMFGLTPQSNLAIDFEIGGSISSESTFTSIMLEGQYGGRSIDPGTKSYDPLASSLAWGQSKPGAFFVFGYHTTATTDPGPFVSIA